MSQQRRISCALCAALLAAALTALPASAQIGVTRNVLLQEELEIPGYQIILAEVTIEVGGREGRHVHSGSLAGKILQGQIRLELDGGASQSYTAGDSLLIPAGQVHEGINVGDEPVQVIATFVAPIDKPLTTQLD